MPPLKYDVARFGLILEFTVDDIWQLILCLIGGVFCLMRPAAWYHSSYVTWCIYTATTAEFTPSGIKVLGLGCPSIQK